MRARPLQAGFFLASVLIAVALDRLFAPGLSGQILILAPAVALLGLPHGALDLPMAETLWPLARAADRVRFFAAYLSLVGVVVVIWCLAPGPALAAFLAYSALHFSGDWAGDGRLAQVTGGISAIGAPALLHTGEVADIFGYLVPAAAALPAAEATAAAGALAGALLVASTLRSRQRGRALAEQGGLWLGAALLPPLLYFVAYFCLLHSARHFAETLPALPDRRRALRDAAGVGALSVGGAAAALAIVQGARGVALDEAALRIVFIGLAALTVPHMLLVERFRHRAERVAAGSA